MTEFDIAPSKIKMTEICDMAECILDAQFQEDPNQMKTFAFSASRNASAERGLSTTNPDVITTTTALLNKHRNMTLQVTMEETAGYTMLGIFAVHFAEVLSQ